MNTDPQRRLLLKSAATALAALQSLPLWAAEGRPQVELDLPDGVLQLNTEAAGRHAFLLDVGRAMGSRHHVEIDGQVAISIANHWLPPTAGFVIDLPAGEHRVKVQANDDAPVLFYGPEQSRTHWRTPVAEALDYVVIAGSAAEVMASYRRIAGAAPLLPRWAYGYIHSFDRG